MNWVWVWNENNMPDDVLDPIEVEKEYGYFPDLGRDVILMTEDLKEIPVYFDQLPEADVAKLIGMLPQLKKCLEDIADFGAKNPGRGDVCSKMAEEILSTI